MLKMPHIISLHRTDLFVFVKYTVRIKCPSTFGEKKILTDKCRVGTEIFFKVYEIKLHSVGETSDKVPVKKKRTF